MSELRKDPVGGRWVIISEERGARPTDFGPETFPTLEQPCPFCPGHEEMTPPEIDAVRRDGDTSWTLRVVPNKYPALRSDHELEKAQEGLYESMGGVGAHEVIIETPRHELGLADLGPEAMHDVIWSYRERMAELKRDPRLRYTLVFRNHGRAAGASLAHPHSQVISLPIIPKRVAQELRGAKRYFKKHGHCVFCDIVEHESTNRSRWIAETREFVALAPYAARFPFETWMLPKRHSSDFESLDRQAAEEFSGLLQEILKRMKRCLHDPPYNFMIHTAPHDEPACAHYHWHVEIIPKLTRVAGFEWGTGFYINPTPPESAAAFLREAVAS